MMKEIKQRIVGAIIFVIFISIMVPPILDGHNSVNKKYSYIELNKRFGDFELPELIFIENKNPDSSVLPQIMLDEIENT